jgi:pilus assembly protein CpaE
MHADFNTRSPRAILVDSDETIRKQLKSQLLRSDIKVIGESDDIKSGMRLIRGLEPDVVFMELGSNATDMLAVVERLQEEMPRTAVIVSAHDPTPQLILSSMRAGAREFLTRPIDGGELEKAIDHLRKQGSRTSTSGRSRGSVISVFATKGGTGATTMACNLATALAEEGNLKVALIDLNLQMGEVLVHMNLPQRYSLSDAVREGSIDQASLRNVMSQHDCGAYVIVGANRPEEGEDLRKERLVELFGMLNTMFDYIVVDMGRHVDDRSVEVFDLSDTILFVTQLSLPAIRNTAHYLDLMQRLDVDTDKVRLVVNRYHKKYELDLDDLEETVGRQTFWVVPNDYASVTAAANNGVPVITNTPRSKVSRNIKKLAETIRESHSRSVTNDEVDAIAG